MFSARKDTGPREPVIVVNGPHLANGISARHLNLDGGGVKSAVQSPRAVVVGYLGLKYISNSASRMVLFASADSIELDINVSQELPECRAAQSIHTGWRNTGRRICIATPSRKTLTPSPIRTLQYDSRSRWIDLFIEVTMS